MVRDGFPVQAQLKTASEPRSTSRDWGSAAIRGPTVGGGRTRQRSGRLGALGTLCVAAPPLLPSACATSVHCTPPLHFSPCPSGPPPEPASLWWEETVRPRKRALWPPVPAQALRALPSPPLCLVPRSSPPGCGWRGLPPWAWQIPVSAFKSTGFCLSSQAPPSGPEIQSGAGWVAPEGLPVSRLCSQ